MSFASYQESIVKSLLNKTFNAANDFDIKRVVLCGGVACNSRIRELGAEYADKNSSRLYYPSLPLCTDNAAMIAITAHYKFLQGKFASMEVGPDPRLSFQS